MEIWLHAWHGFGDCRRPLAESAQLIEEIVHQQMLNLLLQASHTASLRGARFVGIEDFLYLMRNSKAKLKRLLKYLEFMDVKHSAVRGSTDGGETSVEDVKPVPIRKRILKVCYDFLDLIDNTGELVALFDDDSTDEIKLERMLRAELQSRNMDPQQYIEYCEARQVTFSRKFKSQKFRDWIISKSTAELKPNSLGYEVLSFLAYETVAQLVDLALLVKRDMSATVDDPFANLMPSAVSNHEHQLAYLDKRSAAITIRTSTSRPQTPSKSPPATPQTPSSQLQRQDSLNNSSSSLGSQTQGLTSSAGSSSSNTQKSGKKRKKSEAVLQVPAEFQSSSAIQPSHIREAMRRYNQIIEPFARRPIGGITQQMLCC